MYLPLSIGLVPWGIVIGVAMISAGLTPAQAMGMNMLLYSGTAQLGTLPLIAADMPIWLILATALALNLRLMIFSASIARAFRGTSAPVRWFSSYLLTDTGYALCAEKMLASEDRHWRLGYYLAPAIWGWLLWQVFALVGVFAGSAIPKSWSIEFMASIALLILLVPMVRLQPMLVAAVTGGATAVVLRGMPMRLGVIVAIIAGVCAGFAAEYRQTRKEAA